MEKESPSHLVVGGGEKGLEWAARQNPPSYVLDREPPSQPNLLFIHGDVLSLTERIEPNSVSTIYADFLLNAVSVGVSFKQIIEKPEILRSEPFPPAVRTWFREIARGSHAYVRANLTEIRWLLRKVALQQMWQALAPGGEIIIVDKKHVVDWVKRGGAEILEVDPEAVMIESLPLVQGDFDRSSSLKKTPSSPIRKICLKKLA